MTRQEKAAQFSRRAMLKAGGALVVSIGMPIGLDTVLDIGQAFAQGATRPPLTPDQLSSYIAVNADGTVSAFFGKMDMGQGLFVAIGQMVAEELDVPFKAVTVIMGDTATSVNQGGASGSTGIQLGGKQMRMAAAEARRVLVEMAAAKLGLPADALTVTDGVVHAKSDASKKASYAELIGGRYFNVQLDWNKQWGNTLYAPGKAKPKDPKDYKIVGQPIAREDIAPKVYAQEDFCTDVKVPGMVHGRMIRPAVAGAVPVKVDEGSIKNIPGAKVVWDKGFLGVVADKEWDAIKAAQQLKVEWSDAKPPFPDPDHALRPHPQGPGAQARGRRQADRQCRRRLQDRRAGDRGRIRMAVPVPCLHGPGLRRGRDQGRQRHLLDRLAEAALRAERHRALARHPGREGALDLGGRPRLLRPQRRRRRRHGRRHPGEGGRQAGARAIHPRPGDRLGSEGPGLHPPRPRRHRRRRQRHRLRVHQQGVLPHRREHQWQRALRIRWRGNSAAWRSSPATASACRRSPTSSPTSAWRGRPSRRCSIAPRRCAARICAIRSDRRSISPASRSWTRSRRRSTSIRSSSGCVTSRSPRDIAVIKAAAEKAGWQSRPSPRKDQTGSKVSGRGIAYSQRNGTRVAIVAEVDVDRSTGKIWARKFTVAHDCGQIINPDGLRHTIEGNIVQGVSRTLWEEVKFDTKNVTSIDWMTYPILDITETPDTIDVVLIDHPEIAPSGAASRRSVRSRRRSPTRSSTPPACASAACRSRPTG